MYTLLCQRTTHGLYLVKMAIKQLKLHGTVRSTWKKKKIPNRKERSGKSQKSTPNLGKKYQCRVVRDIIRPTWTKPSAGGLALCYEKLNNFFAKWMKKTRLFSDLLRSEPSKEIHNLFWDSLTITIDGNMFCQTFPPAPPPLLKKSSDGLSKWFCVKFFSIHSVSMGGIKLLPLNKIKCSLNVLHVYTLQLKYEQNTKLSCFHVTFVSHNSFQLRSCIKL